MSSVAMKLSLYYLNWLKDVSLLRPSAFLVNSDDEEGCLLQTS